MLTKAQWEWIAASRVLSRQRASIAVQEERLDRLLSSADQAMANAFTGGFRVAQTKLAISKVLPAESINTLAILHRISQHLPCRPVLQRPKPDRPARPGEFANQPLQLMPLAPQIQRRRGVRQAEQAQHPQPVSR